MGEHERSRGASYEMCLVLRADLLVGAPIDLRRFDTESVWFAEHCCLNDAAEASTMALVRSRCTCLCLLRPRASSKLG